MCAQYSAGTVPWYWGHCAEQSRHGSVYRQTGHSHQHTVYSLITWSWDRVNEREPTTVIGTGRSVKDTNAEARRLSRDKLWGRGHTAEEVGRASGCKTDHSLALQTLSLRRVDVVTQNSLHIVVHGMHRPGTRVTAGGGQSP